MTMIVQVQQFAMSIFGLRWFNTTCMTSANRTLLGNGPNSGGVTIPKGRCVAGRNQGFSIGVLSIVFSAPGWHLVEDGIADGDIASGGINGGGPQPEDVGAVGRSGLCVGPSHHHHPRIHYVADGLAHLDAALVQHEACGTQPMLPDLCRTCGTVFAGRPGMQQATGSSTAAHGTAAGAYGGTQGRYHG